MKTDETKGKRYNKGKVQLSYILQSKHAVEGLARVFEKGEEKYGRENWKKGLEQYENVDSLLRHLTQHLDGVLMDKESGLPHIDHVLANAYIMSHFFHMQISNE